MRKLILSLLMLSFLVCGCTNVDTKITINKDKSANVAVNLVSDKEISDKTLQGMSVLQNYDKFLDEGYSVGTEKNDSIKAVKSVKNIEKEDLDLSSLGFVTNLPSGKFIEVKKNFFVTSYNVDMNINLAKEAEKIQPVTQAELSSGGLKPEYLAYADKSSIVSANPEGSGRADFAANYENNLNISADKKNEQKQSGNEFNINNFNAVLSIQVPSFASYNNADDSEGNTYFWTIKKDNPTVIRFQYVVYSGFAITFILLVGIGLLIYIARRIVRHEALKRIGSGN